MVQKDSDIMVLAFAKPVQWNKANYYREDTIVFNGRKSYTALQDVPANIEITNSSYWQETGVPSINEFNTIETDVNSMKTTIGNQNSGLVKDVADNANSISMLETTVGDSNSGLVHDVDSLENTVGDANSGLVKNVSDNTNSISSIEITIGNSSSGLIKDIADNTSDIQNLESDMDNVKITLYTPVS